MDKQTDTSQSDERLKIPPQNLKNFLHQHNFSIRSNLSPLKEDATLVIVQDYVADTQEVWVVLQPNMTISMSEKLFSKRTYWHGDPKLFFSLPHIGAEGMPFHNWSRSTRNRRTITDSALISSPHSCSTFTTRLVSSVSIHPQC